MLAAVTVSQVSSRRFILGSLLLVLIVLQTGCRSTGELWHDALVSRYDHPKVSAVFPPTGADPGGVIVRYGSGDSFDVWLPFDSTGRVPPPLGFEAQSPRELRQARTPGRIKAIADFQFTPASRDEAAARFPTSLELITPRIEDDGVFLEGVPAKVYFVDPGDPTRDPADMRTNFPSFDTTLPTAQPVNLPDSQPQPNNRLGAVGRAILLTPAMMFIDTVFFFLPMPKC